MRRGACKRGRSGWSTTSSRWPALLSALPSYRWGIDQTLDQIIHIIAQVQPNILLPQKTLSPTDHRKISTHTHRIIFSGSALFSIDFTIYYSRHDIIWDQNQHFHLQPYHHDITSTI